MRLAIVTASHDFDFVSADLSGKGHHCHAFDRVSALYARLRNDTFDLIVLDADMPDHREFDTLFWMEANLDDPVPLILVTERRGDEDVVAGLDAGADDYIVKPVARSVLLARINALMRRIEPREASIATESYGAFTLHPARRVVFVDGETIALTVKEFELAATLFRNLHKPLSRAYLLEMVWGRNPDMPTRTLDVHISRIRTKLGLRPDRGFRLIHVYSYGYRLESVIEELAVVN